jgi:hypothetical protein
MSDDDAQGSVHGAGSAGAGTKKAGKSKATKCVAVSPLSPFPSMSPTKWFSPIAFLTR